jgi:hypothetical protein
MRLWMAAEFDCSVWPYGGDVQAGCSSGRYGAFQACLCERKGAASTHARAIALRRSGIVHVMV